MTTSAAQHDDREHVLVTGGAGFIGRELVVRALAAGKRVCVLDDFSTGTRDGLPAHDRLAVIEGSVTDRATVRAAARGVTHVLHLASVVGMRLAVANQQRAWDVAVQGTRAVLEETRDCPVVLFSSSAVYGPRCANPAREDAPNEADALEYDGGRVGYAAGKRALESLGLEAAARGRDVLIVRPFNVVGPGQSGAYGMVVPTLLEAARSGRPMTVYDDGQQTRAFSDLATFCTCLERLVRARRAGAREHDVINIGAPQRTTIRELAEIVRDELAADAAVEFIPYDRVFPGRRDVPARVPDVTRLTSSIGSVDWPSVRTIVRALVAQPAERVDDPLAPV